MKKEDFTFDGGRLKSLRENNSISFQTVAEATNISITEISNYENNRDVPGISDLVALADFYCVSVDYILGRSDVDGNPKEEFIAVRKAASEKWLASEKSIPIPAGCVTPYPYNLVEEIFGQETELPMTDDQIAGLEYALSTLPERDVNMVRLYYEKHMSLREIAEVHGLSRGRVHQIILKILRQMRHPSKKAYILYGFEGCQTRLRERGEMLKTHLPNAVDEFGIDCIPLSTRAYNCLFRARLTTIGQVCEAIETGRIYGLRNLGTKTLEEILNGIETATGKSYRDTNMRA